MIGNNIKFIRKAHDMTRPEFARIVGISTNSLSSYEKGASIISTELIDKVWQKFNVSYVNIVGKEKILNPVRRL